MSEPCFVLLLNDMRAQKTEVLTPVCRASTREALLTLLNRERVAQYADVGPHHIAHTTDAVAQIFGGTVVEEREEYCWTKSFRKGGPLEWFNPPWGDDASAIRDVGSLELWIEQTCQAYERDVLSIPEPPNDR